jgi:antirestriction protein
MTVETKDTPRIYVACLAAYNEGYLHGKWIDADQDEEAIYEEIKEMMADSPVPGAEEWAIHDYDNFGGMNLSEFESIEDIVKWAGLMAEHGTELVAGLVNAHGGDFDEIENFFENGYLGVYDSVADYLYEMEESSGSLKEVPERYRNYIDWDSWAHDCDCNGDFTEVWIDGKVHLFDNYA